MNKAYKQKLTHKEIIKLFNDGHYHVSLIEGIVWSERTEIPLFVYEGNEEGHLFTRLYHKEKMRTLPVAHCVWLAGTQTPLPEGFQVHHRDCDHTNNTFSNLFALHAVDHAKLHGRNLLKISNDEEIPF